MRRRELVIEPDLVWTRHGRSVAVADAKYFKERAKLAGDREGIFQMLAYCVAEGVKEGHLIYAAGHADPTTYTVKTSGSGSPVTPSTLTKLRAT
jgi:5-methylcytosine-specific restriction enzyme subunit McrC